MDLSSSAYTSSKDSDSSSLDRSPAHTAFLGGILTPESAVATPVTSATHSPNLFYTPEQSYTGTPADKRFSNSFLAFESTFSPMVSSTTSSPLKLSKIQESTMEQTESFGTPSADPFDPFQINIRNDNHERLKEKNNNNTAAKEFVLATQTCTSSDEEDPRDVVPPRILTPSPSRKVRRWKGKLELSRRRSMLLSCVRFLVCFSFPFSST